VLEDNIATYGVGSNNNSEDFKYHIFVISKSGIKLFYTADSTWSQDINKRVETSDFIFVYEELGTLLNTPEVRDLIDTSFLF